MDRDVEEDVAEADQRRADTSIARLPRQRSGSSEPERHDSAPATIGRARRSGRKSPGVHREQQRERGEQRGEHADRSGAGAELEGVERDGDLAAALADRLQHRQQHDEIDRQSVVPYAGTRFCRAGRVY